MAPFIGAALSIVLFGEPVTSRLVVGAALMGVGLCLHLMERHEHEHEAINHEHRHTHDAHHQHAHGPVIRWASRTRIPITTHRCGIATRTTRTCTTGTTIPTEATARLRPNVDLPPSDTPHYFAVAS